MSGCVPSSPSSAAFWFNSTGDGCSLESLFSVLGEYDKNRNIYAFWYSVQHRGNWQSGTPNEWLVPRNLAGDIEGIPNITDGRDHLLVLGS